jgi:DNA mismatch repair protein MutS2
LIELEFPKVLELCAEYAASQAAKAAITAFKPKRDKEALERELDRTDEAYTLVCKYGAPRFSDSKRLVELPEVINRAISGGVLSLGDLLGVKALLGQVRTLLDYKAACLSGLNLLYNYFTELHPEREFYAELDKAIISEEELADDASPELKRIRQAIYSAGKKLRDDLNDITGGEKSAYLRENIVTTRNGRYVVPVKAEYRGKISGLVHDVSSSGRSLFIEPMEVVEGNNAIRELKAAEKSEIDRIIKAFSERVRLISELLAANIRNSLKLEILFAKASYAAATKSGRPIITDTPKITLKKARHPLLIKQIKNPVPIDIDTKDGNVFVITGPNTGGKTAAIKTVGILTLMALSGMPIPAGDRSEIGFFGNVYADIGDGQDLTQSLSTFSGHLYNIIRIIENTGNGAPCLVLLDELGAGTDPKEGAAIAVAVLDELHRNDNALTFATTHYDEVKEFAVRENGVVNAACGFDPETLSPTYRLITGLPGKSDAFSIAARIGLPTRIIERAESYIGEKDRYFSDTIAGLRLKESELDKLRRQAEELANETQARYDELQKQIATFDKKKERALTDIKSDGAAAISEIKRQGEVLLAELADTINDSGSLTTKQLNRRLERGIDKLLDLANPDQSTDSPKPPERPLKVGDTVIISDTNSTGVITGINGERCVVQCGSAKIRTDISRCSLTQPITVKPLQKTDYAAMHREAAIHPITPSRLKRRGDNNTHAHANKDDNVSRPNSIDVRGMNTDEAIPIVDKYMDNCIINGMTSFTIIHGKGEGILRRNIGEHLKRQSYVESYRLGGDGEGGDGATIVYLE